MEAIAKTALFRKIERSSPRTQAIIYSYGVAILVTGYFAYRYAKRREFSPLAIGQVAAGAIFLHLLFATIPALRTALAHFEFNAGKEAPDTRAAIDHYGRALAIWGRTNSPDWVVVSNNRIGFCYCEIKEYERAIPYLQAALKLQDKLHPQGNRRTDAILFNLAVAKSSTQPQEGIGHLDRLLAMKTSWREECTAGFAKIFHLKGFIYQNQGEIEQAREHYERAKGIFEQLNDQASADALQAKISQLETPST